MLYEKSRTGGPFRVSGGLSYNIDASKAEAGWIARGADKKGRPVGRYRCAEAAATLRRADRREEPTRGGGGGPPRGGSVGAGAPSDGRASRPRPRSKAPRQGVPKQEGEEQAEGVMGNGARYGPARRRAAKGGFGGSLPPTGDRTRGNVLQYHERKWVG